jgi:hypothetical protein
MAMDQARFSNNLSLGRALGELQRAIGAGRVDHLKTLGKLKRSLADREWPNEGLSGLARSVIADIETRESLVQRRYTRDIGADTGLRQVYELFERATP